MAKTVRTVIGERIQIATGAVIAGRYVLKELLGSGGYGEVWHASDALDNSRSVAVKLLRPSAASDAAQERFKREIDALGYLRWHPYTVELFDHGWHEGQLYMVMEHLSGGSLATHLKTCCASGVPPALPQVWSWFDQVCQSIAAAHRLRDPGPIIHRDINPNNIMLAPQQDGRSIVKVVDFGVARLGKRQLTHTGEPIGTRGYMSPEQAAGDCERIDSSSDVFALGLLLVEMLTLRVTAPDGALFASMPVQNHRQLHTILPQLRPDVPLPLWAVAKKALQPRAAERYSDAEYLRQATWKAMHGATICRPSRAPLPGLIALPARTMLLAAR